MIDALRNLLRPKPTRPPPAIPEGQRVYAVGDVHGCHAQFVALVAAIEQDDAARSEAETTVVLLGDLVDRGPDSAAVVATARTLQQRRSVRIVAGNHEEMFLDSFDDLDLFRQFLRFGGRETVLSYPVDPVAFHCADLAEAQEMMRRAVPAADRDFIETFEDHVAIGDYLFVHAGIRPGEPIEAQRRNDLRWIREPFLSHGGDHGHVVVHGHTIAAEPELRPNRIGIDTGAYLTGRLTALGLEGTDRWLIEATEDQDGVIGTVTRPA